VAGASYGCPIQIFHERRGYRSRCDRGPGKELLGKPMAMAVRAPNTLHEAVTAKRIDMRQALQIHKLPRQIYAAGEEHQSYSQQSYGYADEPAFQPRRLIVFGHGIY
jgi:hypothetical protein